jgi:hypothetical protein
VLSDLELVPAASREAPPVVDVGSVCVSSEAVTVRAATRRELHLEGQYQPCAFSRI